MANLQVKNLPETLHQELRDIATQNHTTISDLVRVAIENELTKRRWQNTFAKRTPNHLGLTAAELLQDERDLRDDAQHV